MFLSAMRFLRRSPLAATILIVLLALAVRVAFAVFFVGVDHIKHGARPSLESFRERGVDESASGFSMLGPGHEEYRYLHLIDQDDYTKYGWEMATGPYRSIKRQPLVPAFHALIFLAFGQHPMLLYNRLGGALLSALLSGLIYLLGRRMFGSTVGLLAGLISCVSINLVQKSGYIYSELVAVPLTILALYFFFTFTENRRWSHLVLGGIMLGLATLARTTTFLMVFTLPLWLWVVYGRISRPMLVRSLVAVALPLAIIAPWSVRLSMATGRVQFVSERPFTVLVGAYGPSQLTEPLGQSAGLWQLPSESGLFTEEECRQMLEGGEDVEERMSKERLLEYLPTIWYRVPEIMLYRVLVFIGVESRGGAQRLYEAQQTVLFLLFLGGVWVSRSQWRRFSALYFGYLFLGVFIVLVVYAGSRMRYYVDPLIIILASAYVVRLYEKHVQRTPWEKSQLLPPKPAGDEAGRASAWPMDPLAEDDPGRHVQESVRHLRHTGRCAWSPTRRSGDPARRLAAQDALCRL